MCVECDKKNGTNFFGGNKSETQDAPIDTANQDEAVADNNTVELKLAPDEHEGVEEVNLGDIGASDVQ